MAGDELNWGDELHWLSSNNPIQGKANKANTNLSGRTRMDEKSCKSDQNQVSNTDLPQDKAVIVPYTDTQSTEPCKECLMCQQHLSTAFSCIPLTAIKTYEGPVKIWNVITDLFAAHNLIKASRLPNFLGLRIPVDTNLNVPAWRKYLCNYFDQQLVDLIEYGFPLDFDRTRKLVSTLQNHASAKNYPSHVDKYIQEELSHNAILGPLDRKPFDVHISPLMTRDKSNSDCHRTIFDLSFPQGYSVSDGVLKDSYLGTKFQMHYPTVDIIVKNLNDLGPGANIFKVDISRAFRHLRIDLGDIDLLALQHRDKLYLDLSLPFGYRLGAFFFSKISNAVRYIMSQNGHNALLNYIDDLIYCGLPSKIHKPYQFLVGLLQELGLDISQKKLQPPDTKVTCLGIEFDTIHRTMSIPAQKLEVQKADLQSLLGYLLYITRCVKPTFS